MSKAPIQSLIALAVVAVVSACSKDGGNAPVTGAPTAAPAASAATAMPPGMNHPTAQPGATVDLAGIAKADGGLTVAELHAQKDALAGKSVVVRGKVVKLNPGIMGKDWLHVRDGSGAEGTNDLTVTTQARPLPKVGDIVVVSGSLARDKDFGMGYKYDVLLDDAAIKIETPAP